MVAIGNEYMHELIRLVNAIDMAEGAEPNNVTAGWLARLSSRHRPVIGRVGRFFLELRIGR